MEANIVYDLKISFDDERLDVWLSTEKELVTWFYKDGRIHSTRKFKLIKDDLYVMNDNEIIGTFSSNIKEKYIEWMIEKELLE